MELDVDALSQYQFVFRSKYLAYQCIAKVKQNNEVSIYALKFLTVKKLLKHEIPENADSISENFKIQTISSYP